MRYPNFWEMGKIRQIRSTYTFSIVVKGWGGGHYGATKCLIMGKLVIGLVLVGAALGWYPLRR